MKDEVKNLAARHPPRGVPATVSPAVRAQLAAAEEAKKRRDMGAAYDKVMPTPERYAKGGVVRGAGAAVRGKKFSSCY